MVRFPTVDTLPILPEVQPYDFQAAFRPENHPNLVQLIYHPDLPSKCIETGKWGKSPGEVRREC